MVDERPYPCSGSPLPGNAFFFETGWRISDHGAPDLEKAHLFLKVLTISHIKQQPDYSCKGSPMSTIEAEMAASDGNPNRLILLSLVVRLCYRLPG